MRRMVWALMVVSGLVMSCVPGVAMDPAKLKAEAVEKSEDPLAGENGAIVGNGANIPNGANLPNGSALFNGSKLANGTVMANGSVLGQELLRPVG